MNDSMHDPMHDSDDILAGSLGRLPREMAPPDSLEERTVATLRGAGLLQSRSRSGLTLASWVLAASIGAIAFVGGSVISKGRVSSAPVDSTFALTLTGGQIDDSATNVSRAAEYDAWAIATGATPLVRSRDGHAIGGQGSSMVSPAIVNPDTVIVDEVTMNAGVVAKTYFIKAPSRDSAEKIAKNCPHLKYGGRVFVQGVAAGQR
jgi:hypothetical protein